jgi:FG-GAP-like repeat
MHPSIFVRAVALAALAGLSSLLVTGCSDLEPIEADRCGNRIIDVGEACDEGGDTTLCTSECRLACVDVTVVEAAGLTRSYADNPEDAIADGYCPLGQACGVGGLCAAPSGKFRAETSFEFDLAQAEAGDVDGDKITDLVGTGATELRIQFGDSDGAPLTSMSMQPTPSATGPFLLADLDASGGVDLVIPTEGGVVPFFDNNGSLQHRPSPTLQMPREGNVATVDGVITASGMQRRPLLVYAEAQGNAILLRDLTASGNPVLATCDVGSPVAVRRGPIAVIANGLGTGDLIAVAAERAVSPAVCIFAPANPTAPGDPAWTPRSYPLAAGARFDSDLNIPLLWANVDGDPCPELLAPTLTGVADAGTSVFDSGGGCGFATAATLTPSWGNATRALGAGNLDRVGPDELVNARNVFRIDSMSAVTAIGPPVGMDRLRVADFNGDGLLDIAGVDITPPNEPSREAIRLMRTTGPAGTWQAVTAIIETLRPVAQITVGDFDGDRIADLALTEVISVAAQRLPDKMAVSVIYGQRSEIPVYQVLLETVPVVIATLGPRRGNAADGDGADDLGVAVVGTTSKVAASVLHGSAQRSLTAPLAATNGFAISAIAAGTWADPDIFLDLVVYTDASQYVWRQATGSFTTAVDGTPSPIDARGQRDFAIATTTTTDGGTTVVSITPSQQQASVGGVGACPSPWSGTGLMAAGPRPTLQARNLDGEPGDELIITSQPGASIQSIYVYEAIGAGCTLGKPLITSGHPMLGCDAATAIEASTSASTSASEAARRELLAVCRPPGSNSELIRFDYKGGSYQATKLGLQLTGRARRLMVGDFTGDGIEDALSITTVGSVDLATLLVQCAQTDASCDP